ncbi:Gfo/Idh/MocA family protein [Sinomonas terrae]|uniref:Gfo/Idh/MocA family oxidoreductase n=1 Tax=Sinomonas terrae TaxID=2908838 RepID=A0ABS9TXD4_9MICC|nr:Gfo/Idh/MocA family oxidoreductase [Sinomonas terrae]MCH6469087.1 Gfo/Idh/MocA family oxidoreductase [Sinomonas terrae]
MASTENRRKKYALAGTGSRAEMYVDALMGPHSDLGSLVAFVDANGHRMDYHGARIAERRPDWPAPRHYGPDRLEEMFEAERPDALIVTTPDFTHARYVTAALDRGVDVICEKPMTTTVQGIAEIVASARNAKEASGANLVVTFNYRYSPRNSVIKDIVQSGRIGKVTSVHFEWCLDTVHGADYFRRWHRNKANSGGLLVHKSTHHFDLVNWWLGDVPETVYAQGGLRFYGAENAAERGLGERPELSRDNPDRDDPFNLDLAADQKLRGLYLEGEADDGYQRDRDVFTEGIDIEDNLSLVVGYRGGASMAYSLVAHSPWEGYRVAINGTEGRVEIEVVERSSVSPDRHTLDPSVASDAEGAGGQVRPEGTRILLQRHWEPAREIPVPEGEGGHGGGDAMLLSDVFVGPGHDPLHRQAGYIDGIRSVLVGIGANESLRTGQAVRLADFGVPLDDDAPLAFDAAAPEHERATTGARA